MKRILKSIIAVLIFTSIFDSLVAVKVQTNSINQSFEKIKILLPNSESIDETHVRIRLNDDSLEIESAKNNSIVKTFKYSDIKSAEYSYTKNPRWKTGLGLGAASIFFPPMFMIALPIGFTKHRRHWLTIRTDKDYAVLQLSKSVRKIFIPAFETSSTVEVKALGENK